MNNDSLTVGVYGIQDINDSNIPTISHDHALAVLKNGVVVHQTQIERLNRKKHSCDMPEMLYSLLQSKKLFTQDANFVFVDNVAGRSFINQKGNIRFEAPLNFELFSDIEQGRLWWFDKSIKAYILNHELAHIGSCLPFFGAFRENSLLIHFDGGASLSNFSAWYFAKGELKKIEAHWRLKKLSALFNANALTFGIMQAKPFDLNGVPGKLMGFASYGSYSKKIDEFLEKNRFFEDCWKSKKSFYKAVKEEFGLDISSLDQNDKFIQDVAATVQQIFINETFNEIEQLQQDTNADFLYYSGGSALNIVLNTKIVNSGLFNDVFIPPCCNDSGLALGAAAFFDWKIKNEVSLHDAYLNNWDIETYKADYSIADITEVAELLRNGKFVGVCNNMAEIGPRALGNRSILCLANSKELAQKVSMEHKQREWYRPVAPIMLEKNTKYFTGLNQVHHLSKYMLLDFDILDENKHELQGAVHVDGTARIQTIFTRDQNPFIFDLLTYLDEEFDVKALINTSFNGRGEPIVHTLDDAKRSAQNMKLDAIILNGKIELLNVSE